MTLSLREKRRRETARDIQLVTLQLAVQRGLENVTTDDIAASVGISTRTFFNYYANKEAAAIGRPPAFPKEDKEALMKGKGALAEDIKLFLNRRMEIMARDGHILKMIGTIVRSNEKARGILEGFLHLERRELTECLSGRVEDPEAAAALARIVTDAIKGAIFLWEHEENVSMGEALDAVWEGIITAARLLACPPD